jgi:hypothetical protein
MKKVLQPCTIHNGERRRNSSPDTSELTFNFQNQQEESWKNRKMKKVSRNERKAQGHPAPTFPCALKSFTESQMFSLHLPKRTKQSGKIISR